jgi:hypothetical protein
MALLPNLQIDFQLFNIRYFQLSLRQYNFKIYQMQPRRPYPAKLQSSEEDTEWG